MLRVGCAPVHAAKSLRRSDADARSGSNMPRLANSVESALRSLAWLLLQTASLRPPRREVCRGLIAGSSLASLPASAVPRYTDRVARSGGPGAAMLC